jgi:hypothetical protein
MIPTENTIYLSTIIPKFNTNRILISKESGQVDILAKIIGYSSTDNAFNPESFKYSNSDHSFIVIPSEKDDPTSAELLIAAKNTQSLDARVTILVLNEQFGHLPPGKSF